MANDTSKTGPGVETEPAPPSQTPPERLYLANGEYLPWGAVIPGMGGTRVGDEIINNTGDRWDWSINDWDYASKGVDLSVPPGTKFGPVTASGYAQPPVDPLSYYTPQEPQPEPSPYTGAPTRWTDVYRSTPSTTVDLGNVITLNPSVVQQRPVSENVTSPTTSTQTEDLLPDDPFSSVLPESIKNQYLTEGTMDPYSPKPREESYIREDGAIVTPGGTTNVMPQGPATTVTLPPETVESTPAPQTQAITQQPVFEERVTVTRPPTTEFQFQEPAPARNPIVLPRTSVLSRPVITTPLPDLPVNPVLTRNMETMPGRYFRDINYDPEEILAAAMRSMGGRMARRSILNELS